MFGDVHQDVGVEVDAAEGVQGVGVTLPLTDAVRGLVVGLERLRVAVVVGVDVPRVQDLLALPQIRCQLPQVELVRLARGQVGVLGGSGQRRAFGRILGSGGRIGRAAGPRDEVALLGRVHRAVAGLVSGCGPAQP